MKRIALSLYIILSTLYLKAGEQYIYTKISNQNGLTSTVNCIYKEKDGAVWLGTPRGLYSFNGYNIKHFNDSLFIGRAVYDIEEDIKGGIWILTDRWIMHRKKGEEAFRVINCTQEKETHSFMSMCQDEEGLWFGGVGCIYRYTYEEERLSPFCNPGNRYCSIINKVDSSTLMCSSSNGSILVNTLTGEVTEVPTKSPIEVSAVHIDSKGRVWIACYNQGIWVYEKDWTLYRSYSTGNSSLSSDLVICLTEKDGKIWAGTDGGGINVIDPENDVINVLSYIPGDSSSFPAHSIKSIYADNYGNIWAGSTRDGLIKVSPSGMKTYFDSHIGLSDGMTNHTVLCLFQEENNDAIWIGTDGGGLNRFDPATKKFTHYPATLGTKIITISTYSESELALSVYSGGIWIFNKHTGVVRSLEIKDEGLSYFMKYTGRSLLTSNGKNGELYLLADFIKMYDRKTGLCTSVTLEEEGRTSGSVYVIGTGEKGLYLHDFFNIYLLNGDKLQKIGDTGDYRISSGYLGENGSIWLATNNGLCRFDEKSRSTHHIETNLFTGTSTVVWDGKSKVWIGAGSSLYAYLTDKDSFAMFGESDGASPNEYLSKPRLLSYNGDVYIGGVQGLLRIDSEYTIDASEIPQLSLYDISADKERIYSGKDGIYKVPRATKILSISVSTQETDISRHKMYRFSIPGSGKDYRLTSPTLEIRDLPEPGKYEVLVSCTKRNGEWTEPSKIMTIKIPRPWYLSGWFIAGVLVFIMIISSSIVIGLMFRKTSRLQLALKEQEQTIYEEKVRMLINISHELRTPLTLIMAPLKRLLGEADPQQPQTATLQRIYRQSKRMKILLDMVLDLRKFEEGKSGLKIEKTDFNQWLVNTIEDIIKEEDAEGILIDIDADVRVKDVEFDRRKCETILMNILMNAVKHSTKGCHIHIRTSLQENGNVRVSISDEGPGLGDIDKSKMFTRFYQSTNEQYGSGIGLSYSKILVELQGGQIGAENNPDKGATFWWEVPVTSGGTSEIPSKAYLNEIMDDNSADVFTAPVSETTTTSSTRLMLVDDSQDLLDFLREALTGEFTEIITATSGNKALATLNNGKIPDIIVSDVNMPDGDGYRLCSALKDNEKYSHIPVVLLTARGDGQSQIDSYKAGADAFMAKPFEVDTLLELLKGMLRKKKEIKKKYLDNEGAPTSEYGSNEEGFIIRLNKIISDNLSNPDLDQILLCREMGLSRASLFNKMKSITGAGAKEYITRIRIEKAKSLMENTDMPIAEIAEKTGFASQSYFSTAFKNCTGLTPSQYKQQNKKK